MLSVLNQYYYHCQTEIGVLKVKLKWTFDFFLQEDGKNSIGGRLMVLSLKFILIKFTCMYGSNNKIVN